MHTSREGHLSAHRATRRAKKLAGTPVRLPLIYLIVAIAWVGLSDLLVAALARSPEMLARLQAVKGLGFVLVTSGLLFVLLRRAAGSVSQMWAAKQEAERTLARLVSNLPGMAYRCANTPDWPLIFVSDGAEPLTGHAPHDLLEDGDVRFGQLIHPDDRQRVWDEVQAAVERHERFELVYRLQLDDRSVSWVWEQGCAVYDDDGKPRFLEGYITDITEFRRLQDSLVRAQRVDTLGRMAAGLAHDFNNLLMNVLSQSERLLHDETTSSRQRTALRRIRNAAEHGAQLVRKLTALGEQPQVELAVVDINAVARDAKLVIEALAGPEHTIEMLLVDRPLHVLVDRGQLHQALLNLCSNALDAMPDGGTLRIQTAGPQKSATDGDECAPNAELIVRDNGTGMTPEVLEKAFEPLFTTKPAGKGSGLGLFLVRSIIERGGGSIALESTPNEGTTVRLQLPLISSRQRSGLAAIA